MTAKYLIFNIADDAVVTASPSAAAGYPVTALQIQGRVNGFRSTGIATQQIKLAWPDAQRISMVALTGCNFSAAATVMIDHYTTSTFGGTNTNVAATTPFAFTGLDARMDLTSREYMLRRNVSRYFALKTDTKSLIITIADPNNPAGVLRAGRLFVGESDSFTYNHPEGEETTVPDNTGSITRARSGIAVSSSGDDFDTLQLLVKYIPEATDLAKLLYAKDYWKKEKDLWLSKYAGDGDLFEFYGQNAWKVFTPTGASRSQYRLARTVLSLATA